MSVLYFFEEIRNPILDVLQLIAMNIGSEVFLMVLICFLYWNYNKDLSYRIGFAFFYSGLLVQGLKITCRIPRPWIIDSNFHPLEEAIPTATGYSFPSGHSQTAASIFGTFIPAVKKYWMKILLFLAILLVGWSRMYAGVHTPLDVSVGIGSTLIIVFVLHLFEEKRKNQICPYSGMAIVLSVLSILLLVYAFCMYEVFGLVDYDNVADLAKSAGAGFAFGVSYLIETRKIQFKPQGSLPIKLLLTVVGLLVLLGIRVALKPVLSPLGIAGDYFRYAIIIFWVMVGFPLIMTKLPLSKKNA